MTLPDFIHLGLYTRERRRYRRYGRLESVCDRRCYVCDPLEDEVEVYEMVVNCGRGVLGSRIEVYFSLGPKDCLVIGAAELVAAAEGLPRP